MRNCLGQPDGLYCGAPPAERLQRQANASQGLLLSPCYGGAYTCEAGLTTPLLALPAGQLCLSGALVPANDTRCAAPRPVNQCGACAGPQCCERQCGRAYFSCCNGQRGPGGLLPEGLLCYDYGGGGGGVHVPDSAEQCLLPQQTCRAGESGVRCLPSGPAAPATPCSSQYYTCVAGRPQGLRDLPAGLACFNGSVVSSNDRSCGAASSSLYTPNTTTVAFPLAVAGLLAPGGEPDPALLAALRTLIAAYLREAAGNGNGTAAGAGQQLQLSELDVAITTAATGGGGGSSSGGSGAGRRLERAVAGGLPPVAAAPAGDGGSASAPAFAAPAAQRRGRALQLQGAGGDTSAGAASVVGGSVDPPLGSGVPGLPVVAASDVAGQLGAGAATLSVVVALPAGMTAEALLAAVAQLTAADPAVGASPLSQLLAQAGFSVTVTGAALDAAVVSVVPFPSPSPVVAAAPSTAPVGAPTAAQAAGPSAVSVGVIVGASVGGGAGLLLLVVGALLAGRWVRSRRSSAAAAAAAAPRRAAGSADAVPSGDAEAAATGGVGAGSELEHPAAGLLAGAAVAGAAAAAAAGGEVGGEAPAPQSPQPAASAEQKGILLDLAAAHAAANPVQATPSHAAQGLPAVDASPPPSASSAGTAAVLSSSAGSRVAAAPPAQVGDPAVSPAAASSAPAAAGGAPTIPSKGSAEAQLGIKAAVAAATGAAAAVADGGFRSDLVAHDAWGSEGEDEEEAAADDDDVEYTII
jgi:hypothetical protein